MCPGVKVERPERQGYGIYNLQGTNQQKDKDLSRVRGCHSHSTTQDRFGMRDTDVWRLQMHKTGGLQSTVSIFAAESDLGGKVQELHSNQSFSVRLVAIGRSQGQTGGR